MDVSADYQDCGACRNEKEFVERYNAVFKKPEVLGPVLILAIIAGGIVTLGLMFAFMLWTKI